MLYNNLIYEIENRINIISINRPEKLNALNIETFSEIKGFGHVKLRNFNNFENQYEQKIKEFKQSSKKIDLAAE